jgi:hypothetical protein
VLKHVQLQPFDAMITSPLGESESTADYSPQAASAPQGPVGGQKALL